MTDLPQNRPPDDRLGVTALVPAPGLARMGASGTELVVLGVMELAATLLGPLTLFGAPLLAGLVTGLFWALRDVDGGRFSPGKRLTGLMVVDAATGAPASPLQSLQRNGALVAAMLLAAVPGPFGWLGALCVVGIAVVEAVSAMVDPEGRRLGDHLAGTRTIRRARK